MPQLARILNVGAQGNVRNHGPEFLCRFWAVAWIHWPRKLPFFNTCQAVWSCPRHVLNVLFGGVFFYLVLKIETSKSTRSSNLVDQHFLRFFQLRTWDCPDQDMSQFMEKIRERWRRRNRRWQALAWCCGWKKVAQNKRNKRCCCCFARFLQPQMALSIEKNMEKWSSNGRNHRFFVWYIPY